MRRWIRFAALGGALAVAACSDHPTGPAVSATPEFLDVQNPNSHNHLFRMRNDPHGQAGRGGGGSANMVYHGGPLLLTPNVAAVYWSNGTIYAGGPAAGSTGTGSQDNSLVGYFMRNLGASSYWNINTTYFNGSNAHVQRSLGYTQFWAANVNVPASGANVSDAQIQGIITTGFTSGKLTWDANTIYAVFSAAGVNLGGGFGTQYCAYHGNFTWSGHDVKYAVMPRNIDFPSACTAGQSPNGDAAADAEVNTLAHELEEATTDPDLNAWYDRRGEENADKCAWNFGTVAGPAGGKYSISAGTKNFLVQMNWINSGTQGCRNFL